MKRNWFATRVSDSELCLIDSLKEKIARGNRTQTIMLAVISFAETHHKELYDEFLLNKDAELKASGKEHPQKVFKKRIKETKEETKSKLDDGQI